MNLLHGNTYELIKRLPDDSVDLVVTDPPYLINTSSSGFVGEKPFMSEIDEMKNGFKMEILDQLVSKMKSINAYIFCSQKQIPILIDYFVKKHGCNWNILTWHKTNPIPVCRDRYLSDTEYIFFAREKGVKVNGSYHTKKTYWVTPTNVKDKRKYDHPTIKPLEIVETLITNSSNEGDTVLDPFMGSGTTGVASRNLKRDFIGIELKEEYYNTAKKRIDGVI